jgi:hypothetical protein
MPNASQKHRGAHVSVAGALISALAAASVVAVAAGGQAPSQQASATITACKKTRGDAKGRLRIVTALAR